jgi:hypothetical protein
MATVSGAGGAAAGGDEADEAVTISPAGAGAGFGLSGCISFRTRRRYQRSVIQEIRAASTIAIRKTDAS